jgi:putative membrane protein
VALAAALFALTLRRLPQLPLALTGGLHIGTMWFWHAPAAYAWALETPEAYWVMEITLFTAAVAFWRAAFDHSTSALSSTIAMLTISMLMGALGAVISFAPAPLYAPHAMTTLAWGLDPLEDQQLAGLVFWVVGAAPYLLCAIYNGAKLAQPRGHTSWLG